MSVEQKVAEAPFDDARADLILLSKDKEPVLFLVYKSILAVASPVFADMFSLPSQGPSGEIQVVDLTENSEALDLSLRHIYPVPSPAVSQLHQVHLLTEFARKYQVDALGQDIERYLTNIIDRDPVGVFALATTYKYEAIKEQATRSALNVDFSDLKLSYLTHASLEPCWDLLRYHVACGKAASAVTLSRNWFSEHSLGQNNNFFTQQACKECVTKDSESSASSARQLYGPRCLWNYLHRSAIVLAHRPTPNAITEEIFVLGRFDCTSCREYRRYDLLAFSKILGTAVQRAIAKIPLPSTLKDPEDDNLS